MVTDLILFLSCLEDCPGYSLLYRIMFIIGNNKTVIFYVLLTFLFYTDVLLGNNLL